MRCITIEIRVALDSPIMDRNIMDAFGPMDLRKTPGINDLSNLFYKENKDVVRKDMVRLFSEILNRNRQVDK